MANKNRSVVVAATITMATAYIVPSLFNSYIKSLLISNKITSATDLSLSIYNRALDTTTILIVDLEIAANSVVQISDMMYMEPGDAIKVEAGVNDALTVCIVVTEEYKGGVV